MIRKISKYILMVICCFIGMISVSAREMNMAEVEEELKKISPEASYIYVIGEYAFSSTHIFTREDNLLAARSIIVKDTTGELNTDAIWGEMTIYRYKRLIDDEGNPSGLEYDGNMAGVSSEQEKLNIRYIDYVFIPDISKADLKKADEEAYKKLKDQYGIDFKNDDNLIQNIGDSKNVELSGKIFYNDDEKIDENIFDKKDLTGYYYTFVVKVDNLKDDTVVFIDGKKYTKADFDENGELVALVALHPENEISKKNVQIKVDLDGDGKDYIESTYTIDYSKVQFKKVLDVDKTVSDNMKAEDSDVLASTLNNGILSIEQIGVVDPLNTTTGAALINALKNTLATDGVKSITLNYNGKDYELTESNLESKIAEILKDVAGKDYDKAIQNDVIGKSIKMTVNLEDGNISIVTPDGKSTVEYTIDFTGTKAEETSFTVSVDKNDSIYNKDTVKDFLNNVKYNALDTNLTLVAGKLTGTVLENKNVGDGFSTRPEDITGYYFTYVITLDEPVTDDTIIILPGDGSTKIVKSDSFDSDKSIVIMHALKPDATNKSFDITVDYDGDGKGYLPKTYTIDYTGVKFLTPEDMLKLAAENTEKVGKYESKTVVTAEDINGNNATSSYDSKSDFLNKVMYLHSKNADNEEEFGYITEKNGNTYLYYSNNNIDWFYMIEAGFLDWTPAGLLDELFPAYKKVERVEATEEGTIKLAVTHTITSVENNDENGNTVYEPVNDAISYVTIKDNKLVRIDTDLLALFEEEIQDRFKYFTQEIQVSTFTGDFTIPEDVVNNAVLVG